MFNPVTEVLTLMNPSAFALWQLCDGETTPEEMVAAVADLTKVDEVEARQDVEKGLSELAVLGLVRLGSENNQHDVDDASPADR